MSESPLSARYQPLSYRKSAFNWNDTDTNRLVDKRLSFIAENKSKPDDSDTWFPTVADTHVNIEILANNPKATRHSKISEHGGYTPVITEFNSPSYEKQADSHQEYKDLIGNQLDTDNAPEVSNMFTDRMDDVSRLRPNFPRSFKTLSRAQFVSELVAGRIMTGQPLGRKRNRG
jgi:hypothetical protein